MAFSVVDCVVKRNCRKSYDCDWCSNYSEYQAIDRRILSPKQQEIKTIMKQARKELRSTEASKRGKRNRITGRRSEKYMMDKYNDWGITAEKQPGSGKFKGKYASDIKVTLLDKERLQEDKTRGTFNSYFNRVKDKAIMYDDFCILMNERAYYELICIGVLPDYINAPDKRMKTLHDYFNQDNAEIVSMRLPGGRECVYAIKLSLWEEFVNVYSKVQNRG